MRRSMLDQRKPSLGRITGIIPIMLVSAMTVACPRLGHAQTLENAQWNSGTGNWSSTSDWTTTPSGTYPNNNGTYVYNVDISGANSGGAASDVSLDTTVAINNLTLDNSCRNPGYQ